MNRPISEAWDNYEASKGYEKAALTAVDALREWQQERSEALPESAWDLPKDCPIWNKGLSAFQAGWVLAKVRTEVEL